MSYQVVRPGGETIPNRKKSWYKGGKEIGRVNYEHEGRETKMKLERKVKAELCMVLESLGEKCRFCFKCHTWVEAGSDVICYMSLNKSLWLLHGEWILGTKNGSRGQLRGDASGVTRNVDGLKEGVNSRGENMATCMYIFKGILEVGSIAFGFFPLLYWSVLLHNVVLIFDVQ